MITLSKDKKCISVKVLEIQTDSKIINSKLSGKKLYVLLTDLNENKEFDEVKVYIQKTIICKFYLFS